jgi:hypothetical protein
MQEIYYGRKTSNPGGETSSGILLTQMLRPALAFNYWKPYFFQMSAPNITDGLARDCVLLHLPQQPARMHRYVILNG